MGGNEPVLNNAVVDAGAGQVETPSQQPVHGSDTKAADTTKKTRISKAQQYMFFAVLGASLVAGVTMVLSIYLIKHISFNAKVISAKDEAIGNYETALTNAAVLRENILSGMTANVNLDSVARESVAICKKNDNEVYTYSELQKKYEEADTDEKREYYLGLTKMCSSLRVIPDALPGVENNEALMSSLDRIFRISNWQPESLTPGTPTGEEQVEGVNGMGLSLEIEGGSETTMRVLANIEKSIRDFSINSANIEWSGNNLSLSAQATAYYTDGAGVQERPVTIDPEEEEDK